MSARLRAVIIFSAVVAAACAHHGAADPDLDQMVARSLETYRAMLGKFPPCERGAKATEVDELPRGEGAQPVAARGVLAFSAHGPCTMERCDDDAECCNGCFPKWVVVPTDVMPLLEPYKREIPFRLAGQDGPMGFSARDCVLNRLRKQIPRARVIVTGTLQKDDRDRAEIITDASVCVIGSPR
jgi:hypothetical protein